MAAETPENAPPRWLATSRERLAAAEPLRVGSDLHLLEMAVAEVERLQQELVQAQDQRAALGAGTLSSLSDMWPEACLQGFALRRRGPWILVLLYQEARFTLMPRLDLAARTELARFTLMARLAPGVRSATEADWQDLERHAAEAGAPGRPILPREMLCPGQAMQWHWRTATPGEPEPDAEVITRILDAWGEGRWPENDGVLAYLPLPAAPTDAATLRACGAVFAHGVHELGRIAAEDPARLQRILLSRLALVPASGPAAATLPTGVAPPVPAGPLAPPPRPMSGAEFLAAARREDGTSIFTDEAVAALVRDCGLDDPGPAVKRVARAPGPARARAKELIAHIAEALPREEIASLAQLADEQEHGPEGIVDERAFWAETGALAGFLFFAMQNIDGALDEGPAADRAANQDQESVEPLCHELQLGLARGEIVIARIRSVLASLGHPLPAAAATVHILHQGQPVCPAFLGQVPAHWPAGQLWTSLMQAERADCVPCLRVVLRLAQFAQRSDPRLPPAACAYRTAETDAAGRSVTPPGAGEPQPACTACSAQVGELCLSDPRRAAQEPAPGGQERGTAP